MKEVFINAFDVSGMSSAEDLLVKLCKNASETKRRKYTEIVLSEFSNHNETNVNPSNAYEISKKLCEQEEKNLKELLKI